MVSQSIAWLRQAEIRPTHNRFIVITLISLIFSLVILFILVNQAHAAPMKYQGVNISGSEWASHRIPGRFDYDYIFPIPSEIDYFANKGMNIIRVPFLWERMQPTAYGPLDATYAGRYDAVVVKATSRNLAVIVDIHNFGKYNGLLVGTSGGHPNAVFADIWTKLATRYKSYPNVIFGIMTEPVGKKLTATTWLASAQAAINAIRATGATNMILVPGAYWGSANEFVELNASQMIKITDPMNNVCYDVHQYLDYNGSGTHRDALPPADAVATLSGFTSWLRANNKRAMLTEFGVVAESGPLASLAAMIQYMHANSAQWVGYTYWSAGPWWSDYMFGVEPRKGKDRPQLTTLVNNLTPSP
ncbi:MAG: glycoside hydrolase family 5 protein [Candidatus Obscuribacterales bacterium]|nr:glycoside hydrolase family 5 protein [Candidatus Obscuribacterales bacterium]